MNRMLPATIFFTAALAVLQPAYANEPTLRGLKATIEISNADLLAELRAGGLVVYFRHSAATVGTDAAKITVGDCSTQRMMSDVGKLEAKEIGDAFRAQNIPVGLPVIASQFCRSYETAEIAFGKENVKQMPELTGFPYMQYQELTDEQRAANRLSVEAVFELKPQSGNTLLFAHGFYPNDGFGEIPNGGAIVLRPLGQGQGYDLIGRVGFDDWRTLGQ